jgi:hypothetical protein
MCLKKVAYSFPPPAPVRAPLAERPGSAVRRCNRSRADGAEPRPPNWPTQRRPLLLVGSGVAMPVPRPAPPVSTTFANGAPEGFLWSFAPVSLADGLRCAVAGFPLWAAFVRPLSVPAPLASVPRGLVGSRCRCCRSPCVLASPVAPPGRACSPCGDVAAAGIRRSRPWQPQKRIRRNGAYVYNVVPKAFGWKLAEGFNAALVAKVLKGRGHLDVEKVG